MKKEGLDLRKPRKMPGLPNKALPEKAQNEPGCIPALYH
jgi:hypothetical protein